MARVLVIDDDDLYRPMLRLSLEEMGHEVTEAVNGRAGLAAYRSAPAELVITDLVMPDMEGIETIIELRKLNPELKIIAISGGGRGKAGDYLQLATKLGARFTLAKPFELEDFAAAVGGVLAAP